MLGRQKQESKSQTRCYQPVLRPSKKNTWSINMLRRRHVFDDLSITWTYLLTSRVLVDGKDINPHTCVIPWAREGMKRRICRVHVTFSCQVRSEHPLKSLSPCPAPSSSKCCFIDLSSVWKLAPQRWEMKKSGGPTFFWSKISTYLKIKSIQRHPLSQHPQWGRTGHITSLTGSGIRWYLEWWPL
jgi:hypothetical protein